MPSAISNGTPWRSKTFFLREKAVFVFYYYNKDHLGNNREVVDVRGRLHQVTNYYPCGAPYADPAALSGVEHQPYKYNGKELDLMHGLNTYDYGARQYDPILARWDRIDPLAEKYYNVSPYAYCAGDPVNAIDKEGNDITFLIASKGAQEHGHMAAIIGNQSRYYYITAGTGDSDYSIYSNSGQHGILAIYSIEASSMDKAISIVRNNDTNNSYYDDFFTFSTSSKMDENMLSTAYEKQIKFQTGEEEYRLFTNNCADIVKDIFEEGTNVDLHMGISPRPNDNFENIKENKIEIQYDIYNELENENKK